MKRVLVISPSGEVYDHDNVRWYNYKDVQRSINHYHNIGDAFVFDSSLKLLNFSKLNALEIVNPKFDDMDRINAEYDFVFLRGSNYVHKRHALEPDRRGAQAAQDPGDRLGHRCAGPGEGQARVVRRDEDRACA